MRAAVDRRQAARHRLQAQALAAYLRGRLVSREHARQPAGELDAVRGGERTTPAELRQAHEVEQLLHQPLPIRQRALVCREAGRRVARQAGGVLQHARELGLPLVVGTRPQPATRP